MSFKPTNAILLQPHKTRQLLQTQDGHQWRACREVHGHGPQGKGGGGGGVGGRVGGGPHFKASCFV